MKINSKREEILDQLRWVNELGARGQGKVFARQRIGTIYDRSHKRNTMTTKSQVLKKNQVLSALVEVRQNILTEASRVSDAQGDQVFLGIWSIKDLLAHLAGWDYTNMEAVSDVLAGKLPSFYAHHDRDWAKYNAMLVAKYKRDPMEELIKMVRGSQRELIQLLDTIPPEVFKKDFGVRFRGYKVTIQRLLEAELEDEQIHLQQIVHFMRGST